MLKNHRWLLKAGFPPLTAGGTMSSPEAPMFPSLPPVGELTIPLYVGTVMNWMLLGALGVQIYIYFLAFPRDRPFIKILVALVGVAEICQTMGDSRDTAKIFGAQWGDANALDEVGWAFFSVPVLGSLVASVGQIFFAYRIHVIGQKALIVPAVIIVVTAFQLGAGIWTAILICRAGHFSQLKNLHPPIAWLSATAADDLLIVAGTVFYILKAQEPGFRHTRAILTRIIKVTVTTGVLCAVFAIIDLVLFVHFDGNNFHLGVCIWLSKLYSNSMLAILNSRARIVHDPEGMVASDISLGVSVSALTTTKTTRERRRDETNTGLVFRPSMTEHEHESRSVHSDFLEKRVSEGSY
ncbi:hypothetical protein FB45DRAFT_313632 [Roridomyces roridus]|uniref:DUF6534 domain-containing protein n=1 Tax=Roridomyces roridus TaxID=1738132 RepID=A0AAD7B6T6_9AGAR|nr:hypothetical protein FB45DRAFT_313632 [Roridomyces roridus]